MVIVSKRHLRTAWGVPPRIALALPGQTSAEDPARVFDIGEVDAMFEAIANDGHQVVDDGEIRHDPDTGDLSIGRIDVRAVSCLRGLEFSPDHRNQQIPHTWPTLRFSIGCDPASPLRGTRAGVAVLDQTSMATDDVSRSRLFDDGFRVTVGRDRPVDDAAAAQGFVGGSSRSCWWQIRSGPSPRLIMVLAGDGVASSVLTLAPPRGTTTIDRIARDITDQVCGTATNEAEHGERS